jgi:hypothetical protein
MLSLRTPVAGALLLVMATLAACGGGQGSTGPTASQADATPSDQPTDVPATTPSPGASTGDGGGDVQALADALKPPNATQTFNSSGSGVILTIYTSTDSPDSLKSFYESAITDAGMKIISTSTDSTTNTTALVFARDDNASVGGAIAIGPDPSGSGTNVSVTVSSTQ